MFQVISPSVGDNLCKRANACQDANDNGVQSNPASNGRGDQEIASKDVAGQVFSLKLTVKFSVPIVLFVLKGVKGTKHVDGRQADGGVDVVEVKDVSSGHCLYNGVRYFVCSIP